MAQSSSSIGKIVLPNTETIAYPVKIEAIHIENGEGFEANITPLYTVMGANGQTAAVRSNKSGKITAVCIAVGDIFLEPTTLFEVRFYTPAPASPPEAAAPATQTAKPEVAAPNTTAQAPPTSAPPKQKKRATRQDRPKNKLVSMLEFLAGLVILAGLAYGALLLLIADEESQTEQFVAVLETRFVFTGPSEEQRTSGAAILKIPTRNSTSDAPEYSELRCELDRAEYDLAVQRYVRVGDVNFLNWNIWRSRIFRTLNCGESVPTNINPSEFTSAGAVHSVADPVFLFGLQQHDARICFFC